MQPSHVQVSWAGLNAGLLSQIKLLNLPVFGFLILALAPFVVQSPPSLSAACAGDSNENDITEIVATAIQSLRLFFTDLLLRLARLIIEF
jgi:hypothetical protein